MFSRSFVHRNVHGCSSVHLSVVFTRSFVHVCTNGQKSFNEMKFRICLTLYKECGIKQMFETKLETCSTRVLTVSVRESVPTCT